MRKHYELGEHRSLRHTLSRLVRRRAVKDCSLEAVEGVTFRVRQGETLGIVGGNGSGKSTLLQMVAGITLPTQGWIAVRGRLLALLAVGTGFHPELTGRENVTLFGTILGVPREVILERMPAIAAFAELERHLDTPMKRYSDGMQARLSFAIAMLFPAEIYLFDEVLAVVDSEFQARCLVEIKRLHEAGKTVIFVSHDLEQVRELCQTVLWMDSGQVHEIGPAARVLQAYSRSAT